MRQRILDLIREPIAYATHSRPEEISEETVVPVDVGMDYVIADILETAKLWPSLGFIMIQLNQDDSVGQLIDLILANLKGGS